MLALRRELADEPHDLARGLRIEAGGGLVDQQQIGVLHQRARDADALALAAGERVGATCRGSLSRPTRSSSAKARGDVAGRKPAHEAHAVEPDESRAGPQSRFSITVRRSTRLNSWKIMPMRRRAARSSRARSSARYRADEQDMPEVGSTNRLMQRISVLLPAPEEPMTATTSGRSDHEVNRVERALADGIDLGEPLDERSARSIAGARARSEGARQRPATTYSALVPSLDRLS